MYYGIVVDRGCPCKADPFAQLFSDILHRRSILAQQEVRTNEEQIVARARQEVAARRSAVTDRRSVAPVGIWRWLPPALLLAALVAFFSMPGPLPHKLFLAMGGVCSLRPSHSYFAGNLQLPLESRMTGIYGGFALTLAALLLFGCLGALRLGGKVSLGLLALMFATMVFDGLNSTLAELDLPHLYAPTNLLRLATGLLSRIALAALLVWLWGMVGAPRTGAARRSVLRSPWELLALLALNAEFAGLVVAGHVAFYYPVVLISVVGVIGMMAGVLMLVILPMAGLDGRVTRPGQIAVPGMVAVLLAIVVLAGTAVLRWTTGRGF